MGLNQSLISQVAAAAAAAAKSLQSCLTLCNLIDGSPPGSPISGILQARTLEGVAISFSDLSGFHLTNLRHTEQDRKLGLFRYWVPR